ncbi:MAG: PQQ-like beta-propeller repeat protein, partial [Planctomycetales bacterium]
PTLHEGKVHALGATGLLSCLDAATGDPIWSLNILKDNGAENIEWGMSGSPLIIGDRVIVSPGGPNGKSLVAYHKDTGERVWASGSEAASYSSPQRATLAGKDQVMILNGKVLAGHDHETGERLWSYPWTSGLRLINCAQPLHLADFGYEEGRDQVFVSTAYGKGCGLFRISKKGKKFTCKSLWKNMNLGSKFSHIVVRDHYVYGLDGRVLTCVDLRDGSVVWKDRGFGSGSGFGFGQLLLVDDLLLIQAEKGDVRLVEATPEEYRELAATPALSSTTWNVPALAGRYLLVRSDREAICFELPVVEE